VPHSALTPSLWWNACRGRPPESGKLSMEAAGNGARLRARRKAERFAFFPFSFCTDGATRVRAAMGDDSRPNLIVAGTQGMAERTWPVRRSPSATVPLTQ